VQIFVFESAHLWEEVGKAKVAGKHKGRKPISSERQEEVMRLAAQSMSKANIARQVGLGEATVYRILKAKFRKP